MSSTINNIPGPSSPDPTRLTPEAVIAQLRTMRSQIEDVAPLSKEQRKLVKQRLRMQASGLAKRRGSAASSAVTRASARSS